MSSSTRWSYVPLLFVLLPAVPAAAQWDPPSGQWGKSEPTDLRVMTWNIHDGICSTNASKQEGYNDWTALARIVAAMQPDFLFLQEAGDNYGHGTGSGVDSVADLETTLDLFFHGGTDPFYGDVPVTSWVQKYAPDYDLPYVFVSSKDDGFNRNVIISRHPFVDLNGDTKDRIKDIPLVLSGTPYAPGGNGGIRGFMFAEIDLDDATYGGDLVVGNAHLKAGSSSGDMDARLDAAQNVAYVIDYWFNGAGTGVPDPEGLIYDVPPATTILADPTPVVIGGDWNEDELYNGRRGPADWLTQAEFPGAADGTDRDRSDMTYDSAVHFFTADRATKGGSKLDYLAWQDSIATLRRAFLFDTAGMPGGSFPPEFDGFATPGVLSGYASDHRPVIADLTVPLDSCAGYVLGDANGDGVVNGFDIDAFVLALTDPTAYQALYGEAAWVCQCDIDGDGSVTGFDIDPFVELLTSG